MEPISQARTPGDPASAFRKLRTLHLAMGGAVLAYGLVAFLLASTEVISDEGLVGGSPGLRLLFWLAAAGNFGVIDRVRRRFLTPQALRRRPRPVAQSIATWHVIMYALADAIAVYGLLLFLLTGALQDFLLLAGFALGMLYWLRPKKAGYDALLRRAGDISLPS